VLLFTPRKWSQTRESTLKPTNPPEKRTTQLQLPWKLQISTQIQVFFIVLLPPGTPGVFSPCNRVGWKEHVFVHILIFYNPPFICILFLVFCVTFQKSKLFLLDSSKEEVDIESLEIQVAINQASKGLGTSTGSVSQPISNFFNSVPANNTSNTSNFDDLFEDTSFNFEQIVVLTNIPKELEWNDIKTQFSIQFGILDLEYSALDRPNDVCYLAFKEISVATAAKGYVGPLGKIDLTHSKVFFQSEFSDLDSNLPYRVVLFNIQIGDTIEALGQRMDSVPVKIKLIENRNFAVAFFDIISEWCKVLAQQYFILNNHTVSIVDAIDSTNQAQFYRLFMGWVPKNAKHSALSTVVARISGHLPLHLTVVRDKNNLSRGFAFLIVKTLAEKEKLLNANEFSLKNSKCKFKEARPLKRAPKN
jgi:hypothetical protein